MASTSSTRKSLRNLSRQPTDPEDRLKVFRPVERGDDRAAAILAAVAVEQTLEEAILAKFVDLSHKEYEALFDGYGPLASFSAKISIAYALDIFGGNTRRELDIVRLIRNAFAHSHTAIGFDTEEVENACNLLTIPERTPDLAILYPRIEQPIDSPRKRYIAATKLYEGAFSHQRLSVELVAHPSYEAVPLD